MLIPRRVIATLLGLFYILAFVMTPYWSLLPSRSDDVLVLTLMIGLGTVWSYLSAADIQITSGVKTLLLLVVLLAGMVVLNSRALTSVIPWRGDESTFIVRTRDLISRLPISTVLLASFLFILIIFAVVRKSLWMIIGSSLLEIFTIFRFFRIEPFNGIGSVLLLRWPYVNYWFYMIAPLLAKVLWNPNHEFLYRIIPLVSAVGLVWIAQKNLSDSHFMIQLLWGFSFATIPVVYYYSSILYIELLAVFIMLIVCFHAGDLLAGDFKDIKHSPGWLALVLLGFIKETVIVFLVCFLVTRTIVTVRKLIGLVHSGSRVKIRDLLMGELPVIFCVLYPYMVYIFFRVYLISIRTYTRSYSPNLMNLVNPVLYKITALAYVQQFGLLLLLFFAGLFLLLWRREYRLAFFVLLLFIGVPIFYGLDDNSQSYMGYSRFNLFVLPAILLGSVVVINRISNWRKTAGVLLACVVLASNLGFSPVYLDGTKVPFWGNYLIDTSEHYYPYDQALLWLKNNRGSNRILFSEMFYNYYLGFYFAKYNWHPTYDIRISAENADETSVLSSVLLDAGQNGFSEVLVQVPDNFMPQKNATGDFCLEKVFRNQAHTLLLFSSNRYCAKPSK